MLSIRERQLNLKVYFYLYKGSIDGVEGNNTKEAYKLFQEKIGIEIDGIYGNDTNSNLINVIKEIQTKLNSNGYNLLVDGIVGNNTISAIRDFQEKNNLIVDGIIGDNTYSLLNTNINSWNTIKYFKKDEFTCKCGCKLNNIDINLVKVLDEIRMHFNKPVIITSGSRCESHNKVVGGIKNSKHLYGKAADIVINGVSTTDVLNYTNKLVKEGKLSHTYGRTINMGNAVHVDIN